MGGYGPVYCSHACLPVCVSACCTDSTYNTLPPPSTPLAATNKWRVLDEHVKDWSPVKGH
ncbi:hypothetical protein E2C01_090132 [Portunus trituberculatus]|uniref:Uncharacterized protein n=1 Tax=Portunus trituberculatus TaxID=210409 RepID=A0A5B7JDV8_PORTR|nr:hypothetical protein [Portunus trituberculatus]